MHKKFKRNRRGLSTVIATIIIVAIAIVMAIAVAYWAMGVGNSFTRFEKLQITNAYASSDTAATITVRNTGTATATLDPTSSVFINGQLIATGVTVNGGATAVAIPPGSSATVAIAIPPAQANSGVSVQVTVQSAAGNQYPTVLSLP
ncbi:MAG: archaellin/type IV pilin N-terminal domain-containing protein [Candidatus Bathyarchaeia archaeon]